MTSSNAIGGEMWLTRAPTYGFRFYTAWTAIDKCAHHFLNEL